MIEPATSALAHAAELAGLAPNMLAAMAGLTTTATQMPASTLKAVGGALAEWFNALPQIASVATTEGIQALALIGAALGWGAQFFHAFDQGTLVRRGESASAGVKPAPPHTVAFELLLALTIGVGFLGTTTLVLGWSGMLGRATAVALVLGGLALASWRLYRLLHSQNREASPPLSTWAESRNRAGGVAGDSSAPQAPPARGALWGIIATLVLVPSIAVALYGASLPPGLLWDAEGNGYDVLEYHLQAPREYYEAGRITPLPHNVYASFPQQIELLYLLLMHLTGGVYPAAIAAQWLHVLLGVAAVALIASAAPPGLLRWTATALAGSTPWLAYLGALAYVELGLLLFAAAAGALLWRAESLNTRRVLLAGLCVGWACGCKYTAIGLVAAPLLLRLLALRRGPRLKYAGVLTLSAALTFAPWAVRNVAFTGNPLFPLAQDVFAGADWTATQRQQWSAAHRLPPQVSRTAVAARELLGTVDTSTTPRLGLFGLTALAGGVALMAGAARPGGRWLLLWALVMLAVWLFFSHMPGRFLVPLIIPMAWGAARLVDDSSAGAPTWRRGLLAGLLLACAAVNSIVLLTEFAAQIEAWKRRTGVPLRLMIGNTAIMPETHLYAPLLPADGLTWVVGDAAVFYVNRPLRYHTVFDRDPWLSAAQTMTPEAALGWLRSQKVTHLVFSWREIERLRSTYGFSSLVTRDWVASLQSAGLRRIPIGDGLGRDALDVFEVIAN